MTNLGSAISAQGSSYNGEIGCLVQNTRSWVLTGFNAIAVGTLVKVVGMIDLPSTSGSIGAGYILTYNNTHPTDIFNNGFIVDYHYTSTFYISLTNAPSMNFNSEITLEETLPLRIGYVGPLRFKFSLTSELLGPNQGQIAVRVPGKSTLDIAGGFGYNMTTKHVCQIMDVLSFE